MGRFFTLDQSVDLPAGFKAVSRPLGKSGEKSAQIQLLQAILYIGILPALVSCARSAWKVVRVFS
jgi:hypothetical protein